MPQSVFQCTGQPLVSCPTKNSQASAALLDPCCWSLHSLDPREPLCTCFNYWAWFNDMSPSPAKQWIFFKCPQAPSGSNHSTWYLTSRKPQSSGWGQENCGFSILIQYLGASLQCCSDYSAATALEIFYIILKWITNGTIRLTARLTSGGQYLTASTRTPWLRSGTVQHCMDVIYTSSSRAQSIPGDSWLRALKGWRDWVVLLILSSPFWNISVASGCGSKKASICMRWLFLTHLSSNWCPYCAWETIIVWSRALGAFLNHLSFCEASV